MEETPKALRVAVVEDDPRIQQLISAETFSGPVSGSDVNEILKVADLSMNTRTRDCLLYTSPSPRDRG